MASAQAKIAGLVVHISSGRRATDACGSPARRRSRERFPVLPSQNLLIADARAGVVQIQVVGHCGRTDAHRFASAERRSCTGSEPLPPVSLIFLDRVAASGCCGERTPPRRWREMFRPLAILVTASGLRIDGCGVRAGRPYQPGVRSVVVASGRRRCREHHLGGRGGSRGSTSFSTSLRRLMTMIFSSVCCPITSSGSIIGRRRRGPPAAKWLFWQQGQGLVVRGSPACQGRQPTKSYWRDGTANWAVPGGARKGFRGGIRHLGIAYDDQCPRDRDQAAEFDVPVKG